MRLRRTRSTAILGILSGIAVGLATAATVELRVADENDQSVADALVMLHEIEATTNRTYLKSRAVTDPVGRVVFSSVEPGRYVIRVLTDRGEFVALENHPEVELHSITIDGDDQRHVSTVRVVRGTPVVVRVSVEGQVLPGARLLLHDLDREYHTEIGMNDRIEREVRLVPGRWTARVEPVPGYLLTGVEVNRTTLPADLAEFDLPRSAQAWYVNFEFAAQAFIGGRVTFKGESFAMSVVAHLLEAGSWLPAVQTRGGSQYERVSARPTYPTYEYEMVVPTGLWNVRPEATGLESADPPEAEVRLEAGDYKVVDFIVDGSLRSGGKPAKVRVDGPGGQRVRKAQVEAWPADPASREQEPLARGETGWGDAVLHGLAAEEHTFVAGKSGYVEASATLMAPDPTEGRVRLRLSRGATVHAVARDGANEPAPGVSVTLAREDDFVSLLANREVADWAARPTGETDGSGHLWLRGVYPGRYNVSGVFRGEEEAMYFAEFRDTGDTTWQREMQKDYRGTEIDEIEIRLAPAGVLRATLHCSDGTALPPEADILALDGLRTPGPETAWEEAILVEKAYVLEGERRDTFLIGPLDPGAYRLRVRPESHDRWTWALGTETAEESTVLKVVAGEPTDLGALPVDCSPAIAIAPVPPDGVLLPDLVATGLYKPIAELRGVRETDEEDVSLPAGRLIAEASRIQFRDLPEGEIRSTVTLWNPLFLPRPALRVSVDATLQRGRTVQVSPRLAGIGGAVEIDLSMIGKLNSPVRAIRVERARESPEEEPVEPWSVAVEGTSVIVPSLPAGFYGFDLCFDFDCSSSVPLWRDVRIEAGVILSPTASPR